MKKLMLTFGLLAGFAFSNATLAQDCVKPDAPAIPEGEAASGSDMLNAKKAVEAYVKAAEEFVNCTRSGMQKDRMIADMEEVASRFNRELRSYKAKS